MDLLMVQQTERQIKIQVCLQTEYQMKSDEGHEMSAKSWRMPAYKMMFGQNDSGFVNSGANKRKELRNFAMEVWS